MAQPGYQQQQQQWETCPHCRGSNYPNAPTCYHCKRPIERCPKCGFPITAGTRDCPKCKAFVAKEPKIAVGTYVTGGDTVGEEKTLRVDIQNVGNVPTDVNLEIEMPVNIKPRKLDAKIEGLKPNAPTISKTFEFTAHKPMNYRIVDIKLTYTKSSGQIEKLGVRPVSFEIFGRPIVQLEVEPEEQEVALGETGKYVVKIKNTGTELAESIKFELVHPNSVKALDHNITLPELAVGEEKAAIISLKPIFTGQYECRLTVTYGSPTTGARHSSTFESPVSTIKIWAELEK